MTSLLKFSNCNFKMLNGFNGVMLNINNHYSLKACRILNVFDSNSTLVDKENKNNILSRNKLHGNKTTNDNFTVVQNIIDGKWKSIQILKNVSVRKTSDQEEVNPANRSLKTFNVGLISKNCTGKILRSTSVHRPSCSHSFHTASGTSAERSSPKPEGSWEDRRELHEGLLADSAHVPCKYLYDSFGSKLFEIMCELPDYYLTRTEASIFERHAQDIAASVGPDTTLIDLGAGNCAKAAKLIPVLKPQQYVPVDISAEFLEDAARGLRSEFPELDVQAVVMDFSCQLRLPRSVSADRRIFFYPGSSIGGFTPPESLRLLREMRSLLADNRGGGLLFGFDMIKDVALLDAAYNDQLGILSAFHLNLLPNVNRLLGTDFDLLDWRQKGVYNQDTQCVDLVVEARRNVVVTWRLHDDERVVRRSFRVGECIHTAYSHKFTEHGVRTLLHQAGFALANVWFDPRKWFMVCHARPV